MIVFRSLLIATLFAFSANSVYSCTCSQVSHRKEFRQTDVIFVGRVVGVVEDRSYTPPVLNVPPRFQMILNSQQRFLVRLIVEQRFKGVKKKELTVSYIKSAGSCAGMELRLGEKYLIYAQRIDGRVEVGGPCSRTQRLNTNSTDYREAYSWWFRLRARVFMRG